MKRKRESVAETDPVVPEWKPERQILTAFEVDDKESYKSEGSIELRIDRFAEFVRSEEVRYSAPMCIRGLSWDIEAYSKETYQLNNQDGQSPSKFLSFYLWCQRDSTNRPWECHAEYSLRVIAQKDTVKDIVKENIKRTFNGKDGKIGWGRGNFVTCDFLLDPENGYIKDDTVILQAHVKPLRVEPLSGTHAIASYGKLFSSSTQYSWDFVIVIQNKEVHVQKSLLAMDSEYFKDQFTKYEENTSAILQDVDYEEFIELLSVIYPTSCPISADNVETISKLAFKFNMAALLRQCEIFLMKKNRKFGRAKSLLMAEWYGLERLTGNIIYKIRNITDIKEMKPEYDTLSDRTKRMLFDRICSARPASNPKPEDVDITIDRAAEILQELASSACTPSDGVLIVENNRIPIHKAHLAMNSKYFTAMFQGEFAEKNKDEIVLEEIGYNEILELLVVIYPTASPITEKNVGVILKMADRFIMPAILVRCKKFLQDSTQIRAARKLWLAQRYNLPDLRDEFAKNCKTMSDIEELKAEPEFGLLNDKTRALILDSVSS
ncbi:BTB/POZ domain-containing protein [Ditylenchus destructor]|uniref:BTB/POZ domain-containing protein n=1 Tax=Ditylenchus destructor TaxID=166010 RepID=A0AAD4MLZ9_9BILA|nr:BTB/POZ domain-containing protein [Ditylenchus destructor]